MKYSISPDQVRAEIQKFWQIMCGKSANKLEELYSPDAVMFTGKGRKPEPANVALARRTRQVSAAGADTTVELGALEIQIEEPGAAIASYTYKFHHTRPGEGGSPPVRRSLYGRATQIFQQDQRGFCRLCTNI